jgi:succinoglycan biosynthesis protein ExoA
MSGKAKKLFISIAIPTLNEESYISQSLKSILMNNIKKSDYEVIIVDGGSEDKTLELVDSLKFNLPIKVIIAKGSSVYSALNIALNEASGEYFVRVDSRSLIPINYIEKCIENLHRYNAYCAGGVQQQFGFNRVGRSVSFVTSIAIGTGNAKFRVGKKSGYVDSVYLGVYRTQDLRKLGGFEEGGKFVSEDSLINKRIRESGGKVYLDHTLRVKYPAKDNFRLLAKQYWIYGAAKAYNVRKYLAFTSIRQFIPLVFIISLFLLMMFTAMGLNPFFLILFLSFYIIFVAISVFSLKISLLDIGFRIISAFIIHLMWSIGFCVYYFSPKFHMFVLRYL